MQAGRLKNLITILQRIVVVDAYGAETASWLPFKTLYAAVVFKSGAKIVDNSEVFNDQTVEINIRFDASVNETMRVQYNGKLYAIDFINEVTMRTHHVLVCKRIQGEDSPTTFVLTIDGGDMDLPEQPTNPLITANGGNL